MRSRRPIRRKKRPCRSEYSIRSVAMSDCHHEWDGDLSGDQRLLMCLKCGQRLDTASLTGAILEAGEQLAMMIDPTRLAVIKGAEMPLSWTAEKPAVSGWFWFEDMAAKIGPVIVMWTGSTYSMAGIEGECLPGEQSQWAGPLEPPT